MRHNVDGRQTLTASNGVGNLTQAVCSRVQHNYPGIREGFGGETHRIGDTTVDRDNRGRRRRRLQLCGVPGVTQRCGKVFSRGGIRGIRSGFCGDHHRDSRICRSTVKHPTGLKDRNARRTRLDPV